MMNSRIIHILMDFRLIYKRENILTLIQFIKPINYVKKNKKFSISDY